MEYQINIMCLHCGEVDVYTLLKENNQLMTAPGQGKLCCKSCGNVIPTPISPSENEKHEAKLTGEIEQAVEDQEKKQIKHLIQCPRCGQGAKPTTHPLKDDLQCDKCGNIASAALWMLSAGYGVMKPTFPEAQEAQETQERSMYPIFDPLEPCLFAGTFNGRDVYLQGKEIIVKYGNSEQECDRFTKESIIETAQGDISFHSATEIAAICYLFLSQHR